MSIYPILFAAGVATASSGCSNIERSRNLANPGVTGRVLAEQVCSLCHGADGNSVSPAFPRLAGQQALYVANQLKGFRSHTRSDPAAVQYMWGLCRNLTDAQIDQLAEYYAKQVPATGGAGDPRRLAAGKALFENGVGGDRTTPPCMSCHGPEAQGKDHFPRLASQHPDYIMKQLSVFQRRSGRPNTPMDQIAPNLDEEQKAAIAAYLQTIERFNRAATD